MYKYTCITLHQNPNQAADSLRESPYDCCYLWLDCKKRLQPLACFCGCLQHSWWGRGCHVEATSLPLVLRLIVFLGGFLWPPPEKRTYTCARVVPRRWRRGINATLLQSAVSGALAFCAVAHNMSELFCLSSCTVKSCRPDSLFLDGAGKGWVGDGWAEVIVTESLV